MQRRTAKQLIWLLKQNLGEGVVTGSYFEGGELGTRELSGHVAQFCVHIIILHLLFKARNVQEISKTEPTYKIKF